MLSVWQFVLDNIGLIVFGTIVIVILIVVLVTGPDHGDGRFTGS